MRINRIVGGFCCFLLLLVLTGECLAFKLPGLPEIISDPIKALPNPFEISKKGKSEGCDKVVLNSLLNLAIEKITGVEDVFLIQEEITSPRMADKYLAYADKKSQLLSDASIHLLGAMAGSFKNQEDRKALEAARDAVSQQLEDGDKTDAVVSVGEGFAVYNEKLKACKAVDKKAMAVVWVDTKNLSVRNVEILSLARHICLFTKENQAWGIKNYNKLKPFLVYAKGLAVQTKVLVQTPKLVAAHFDTHDADLLAEAKKNNNKSIEAKLADENGLAEDADEILGVLFRFIMMGWS